jgi:Uncharacterised protein family (UPF0259)
VSAAEGSDESRRKLSLRTTALEGVRTLREQWRLLLAAGLVIFVPLGFFEALDNRLNDVEVDEISDLAAIEALFAALVHSATSLWGEILYTGVVAAGVSELLGGEHRPLRRIAGTLPYGRLIAVDVLYTLIVLAGLVLLFVPGVVFYVWFALAGVVVKIERRGIADSLRRSRELVRGSFWRVAAVVIPAELLSSAVVDGGQQLGHDLADGFAGEWLGASLGLLLATPLYAVAVVVVAFQLFALESRS